MAQANISDSAKTSGPMTTPDVRNVNGVDPLDAAKAAHSSEKAPKTLAVYRIAHTMVGPYPFGTLVSADELGGEDNLPRLFEHGAISLAPGV